MMRVGTREWVFRGAAVTFGLALALLFGEVTVRILEPPEDSRSILLQASGRLYGLAPHSVGYAGGVKYQANSWGYRGRDVAEIDPDRDTVIVVLGDSYAFGYGVPFEESFPSVLEQTLRSKYPQRVVKVITLALPGYNTEQYLAALQEFGPIAKPALVVLAYHLNDIERHGRHDGAASDGRQTPLPRDYVHLLRFILPRLAALARMLNIPVTTTATREVSEYVADGAAWRQNQILLAELAAVTKQLNARIAVVVLPYIVQLDERHPTLQAYRAAGRFFESLEIPTVNAFDYLMGEDAGRLWINPFDGHPNARGHLLIASATVDLIMNHHLLE